MIDWGVVYGIGGTHWVLEAKTLSVHLLLSLIPNLCRVCGFSFLICWLN